jgi:integrase
MDKWLRVHELDDSTRESYEMYARLHLYPVLGAEPAGAITPEMLEEFYADLRRCSRRCRNGQPATDHRTTSVWFLTTST